MFKQLSPSKKGITLAVIAAIISGFAVFINKEGVALVKDSDIYTTLKNVFTAVLVVSFIIVAGQTNKFKKLNRGAWLLLLIIGLIGGSIPFLLFFKGLSMANSAVFPALIHKTLFIWVSIMAVIFLKDKIGRIQIAALALLLLGNLVILWPIKKIGLSSGEILVFAATLIWAVENIIVKIALKRIDVSVVVFGRMAFGSIFLLLYLYFSHKITPIYHLAPLAWIWVAIVGAVLFGYVVFWYSALKYLPVSLTASILVIASPITSLLDSIFRTHKYSVNQIFGSLVIILAAAIIIWLSQKLEWKKLSQPDPA